MGRFGSVLCSVLILLLASLLSGCGHSQSVVTNQPQPVPATLALSPNPTASLEQGHILTFTGTALDTASTTITETITYQSSNPSILTVSTTGLACAGSWDSLTSPQVCTPGPAGTAQVTATAEGVSSPPTTVYVHQHIDNVQITPVAGQLPPTDSCSRRRVLYCKFQRNLLTTKPQLLVVASTSHPRWAPSRGRRSTPTSLLSRHPQRPNPSLDYSQAKCRQPLTFQG